MKKIIAVIMTFSLILLFGCTKQAQTSTSADETQTVTQSTSTTQRITSTTAKAQKNSEKGAQLRAFLESSIGGSKADGELQNGSFELKLTNTSDDMYKNEASIEIQSKAEENAAKLVKELDGFYPDGSELADSDVEEIGNGDNGIDSCRYIITYTNTQNQELKFYADSNGNIYYISCNYTW